MQLLLQSEAEKKYQHSKTYRAHPLTFVFLFFLHFVIEMSTGPFFILKQKKRSKRKIQGCDKKAKKRLRSAKVVKLALYS